MSWSVASRTEPRRRLESSGDDLDFTADPLTSALLSDLPSYRFALTPTGPAVNGVSTQSELFAAAMLLLPNAVASGDTPSYPLVPNVPGVVY